MKWRSFKSEVQLLKLSSEVIRILHVLNTSTDDIIKFVHGHTEALRKSAVEIALHDAG